MTPARDLYQRAALALADVERKIANLTRWQRPKPGSIEERVLAALEARRDRDLPALVDLKIAAEAEGASAAQFRPTPHINFKRAEWMPLGTLPNHSDLEPIPEFLRRQRP